MELKVGWELDLEKKEWGKLCEYGTYLIKVQTIWWEFDF